MIINQIFDVITMLHMRARNIGSQYALLLTDDSGVSAVEFAMIAPLFCMLFAGAADFGGVLYAKLNLEMAVSSASDFAINNANSVTSSSGGSLASNITAMAASSHATSWANALTVVNNGPWSGSNSGVITSGGTASNADSCYCPVLNGSVVIWGAAMTCSTTCSSGIIAGKFVAIVASKAYSPIFASYGIVKAGAITASATVQTK